MDKYKVRHYTKIHPRNFEAVVQGMKDVVLAGTAQRSKIPGIVLCGKTGTVENNKGEEHSTFIGFAPMDKPKIAIAVYVENGGFGAAYAAPISSLMIELYLKGNIDSITRKELEEYILKANLIDKANENYSLVH